MSIRFNNTTVFFGLILRRKSTQFLELWFVSDRHQYSSQVFPDAMWRYKQGFLGVVFSRDRGSICRRVCLDRESSSVGGEGGMRQVSKLWTKRSFAKLSTYSLMVAALAFIAVIGAPAQAQNDKMIPIATPSQPNAIEI